jgi:hypothetical protein
MEQSQGQLLGQQIVVDPKWSLITIGFDGNIQGGSRASPRPELKKRSVKSLKIQFINPPRGIMVCDT